MYAVEAAAAFHPNFSHVVPFNDFSPLPPSLELGLSKVFLKEDAFFLADVCVCVCVFASRLSWLGMILASLREAAEMSPH